MLKTEYVDNFAEFYEQMNAYFADHYENCEEYRAEYQLLDIDVGLYQQMIDQGVANFFILKEEDTPVGYVNVSITPNPLFNKPQAVIDLLYILKEYRNKGYTKQAIAEIEKELRDTDVPSLNIMLPNKEYSEHVAEGLGYHKTSTVYTKVLGE